MTDTKPARAPTPKELAKALGVARGTVYRWIRHGCPREPDGSFDVSHVSRWRATQAAARGDSGAGATAVERWQAARAERIELEVRELRGELIRRDEVEELMANVAAAMRRDMRRLGRKLARDLVNVPDAREIQRRVNLEHDRILRLWAGARP